MSTLLGPMSTLPPLDSGSPAIAMTNGLSRRWTQDGSCLRKSVLVSLSLPPPSPALGALTKEEETVLSEQTNFADIFYYTNFSTGCGGAWSKRELRPFFWFRASHIIWTPLRAGQYSGTGRVHTLESLVNLRLDRQYAKTGICSSSAKYIHLPAAEGSLCMHAVHIAACPNQS
jgi:hypothetical protein